MPIIKSRIIGTPKPPSFLRFALILHDPWPAFGAPGLDRQVPSATQMQDNAVSITSKGATISVPDQAWSHIDRTNDADGRRYARSVGSLWSNIPVEYGKPRKVECVRSGGNIVGYYPALSTNTHIKLYGFNVNANFSGFDPVYWNYFNFPYLYWECSSYTEQGFSGLVWGDVYCFIPTLIASPTGQWLPRTKVWLFPEQYKEIHFVDGGREIWNGSDRLVYHNSQNQRVINDPNFNMGGSSVIPIRNDRQYYITPFPKAIGA